MFNFKRKEITPVQSSSKKKNDNQDLDSTYMPQQSTPIGNSNPESFSTQAPRGNRSRITSIRSAASVTSFKSFSEVSVKSKNEEISRLDFGGTRSGKNRDIIEVDVYMMDGEPYTAQISDIEAYKLIYRKGLDLDKAIFYGVKVSWAGHPLVVFRTKETVDIDKLPKTFEYSKSDFDRDGNEISRTVTCEVRGVRDPNQAPQPRRDRVDDDNIFPKMRWIKLEGTGYDLKEGYLEKMLDFFGERKTRVEKEVLEFPDSESDEEGAKITLATGNLSVKVELRQDMPQFIPLYGQRVKVYYRGINKSCTKCYNLGHTSKECKNSKVTLVEYVEEFMKAYPDFDKELLGRWVRLVEVSKRAKLQKQQQPSTQTTSK